MNQVSADISGEHIADDIRWETHRRCKSLPPDAAVNQPPTCSVRFRIVLVIALLPELCAPCAIPADRSAGYMRRRRAAVIGDVLRHGAHFQQRGARQILHRHHHVADVCRVLRDEPISEIIEGGPELRRSGSRFGFAADRIETEIRSRAPAPAASPGWSGDVMRPSLAVVGTIDPVVGSEPRIRDPRLVIQLWGSRYTGPCGHRLCRRR